VIVARRLWVARLHVSHRTAEKISLLHGITEAEVRAAVVCVEGLEYVWHVHPERGLRAIVKAVIHRKPALVVLYPADDPLGDSYNLGSAYFVAG
jgi:hypothetical protein